MVMLFFNIVTQKDCFLYNLRKKEGGEEKEKEREKNRLKRNERRGEILIKYIKYIKYIKEK